MGVRVSWQQRAEKRVPAGARLARLDAPHRSHIQAHEPLLPPSPRRCVPDPPGRAPFPPHPGTSTPLLRPSPGAHWIRLSAPRLPSAFAHIHTPNSLSTCTWTRLERPCHRLTHILGTPTHRGDIYTPGETSSPRGGNTAQTSSRARSRGPTSWRCVAAMGCEGGLGPPLLCVMSCERCQERCSREGSGHPLSLPL